MSFYNPNIQTSFDAENREFIVLKNVVFATYDLIYKICDDCNLSTINDIKNAYQLQFVRFENKAQQQNLQLIHPDFFQLLAEIAVEAFSGRIKTFDEYLIQQIDLNPNPVSNEILYKANKIQDYIEMLVFSDIAAKNNSAGVRDFTKLISATLKGLANPVYYQIYDRLKLYAKLRKNIRIEIIPDSILLNGRELSFALTLKIE